jgi:hypothetical protein
MSREEFIRLLEANKVQIDAARSEIIRYAIDLDVLMETVIRTYFVDDPTKEKQFSAHIGRKEFFSFHKKVQVIRKLGLHKQARYSGKLDELTNKLYEIMKKRDIVAHNISMAHTPEIWYRDDDDQDKLLSLPSELPQIRNAYSYCYDALGAIFADLISEKQAKKS